MWTEHAQKLTLGLLALSGRPPSDAGAMLVQVEQTDQAFRTILELDHLSARLHDTHTSLD